ncbi:beta-propeller fold lactonase family protein [Planktotalea sp.]|uniref:beta-propeller fold lactonase family protein n=1 Tax=Planktotalea sp. TaxID=2029877 RepID=UPI003D6A6806
MTISNTNSLVTDTLSNTDLNGASGVQVVTIGDRVFAYVGGEFSDRISVLEIFSDGTIGEVDVLIDSGPEFFNAISAFATVEVAGTHYLYAAARNDDALTVFQIGADGSLTSIQAIEDDALTEMDGITGQLTVTVTGAKQFLIAHGEYDDGVSIFEIGADGMLTNTFNLDNATDPAYELNGVSDTASIRVGTKTFVFVTGEVDDAINVFRLKNDGQLTHLSTISDDATTSLNGPRALEVLSIGGQTFLYVGAFQDDAISVFSVASNGDLTLVETVDDGTEYYLNGLQDIELFSYNGSNFLAATSAYNDSVTIFQIAADGTLTPVDTVSDSDDPSYLLDQPDYVQFAEVDGKSFLIATSVYSDSVTLIQIDPENLPILGTDNDDILVGTNIDDTIDGQRGDDIILGEDGDDTIEGGEGSDVISGGAGNDRIQGDGDFTQTASAIETITETGQDLALSVTLPDASNSGSIDINGIINRKPLANNDYNIVYVIDISGSMSSQFQGVETVGDANNDGASNTLMDGTIEAFGALNASLLNAGFGTSDVSVVTFASGASTYFTGSVDSDIYGALTSLDDGGGTNFEAALQQTITALSSMGDGQNVVYFMSDGGNGTGTTFLDEVATLIDPNGLNAIINSVGLGSSSVLADLDLVDDGLANSSAVQVLEPSALTSNLTGSPVESSEVDRLEIYVNGVLVRTLDSTEFSVTPLGLQYDATVSGLNTSAGDVIEVVLVASDTAETEVAVTLTVPDREIVEGDDVLLGGDGDDLLTGNGGRDSLFGENGNDVLNGGLGYDLLKGGAGDDLLVGGRGYDTLISGNGADTLQGGLGNDFYFIDRADTVDEEFGGGFDTLAGRMNINLTDAVWMDDFEAVDLRGTADLSAVGNGVGNLLDGNAGDNALIGGAGDDTINGGKGADAIEGGADSDLLYGNKGADMISGGKANDTIEGNDGDDTLSGDKGDDQLNGGTGNDLIAGGDGDDSLYGANGADDLGGGIGDDLLNGGDGNDTLNGDDGKDTLIGGTGDDDLRGGVGADSLEGGNGQDELRGGDGADVLKGGDQADALSGGYGADTLKGGAGIDVLNGGRGNDILTGGAAADRFVFEGTFGDDTITDFEGTNAEDVDLSSVASIVDFADLTANHMMQSGADVVITDDGGNTITIEDFVLANLGANDFIF